MEKLPQRPVVLPTGNYMPDPAAGDPGTTECRRRRRMVGVLADAAVGLRPLGEPMPRIPPRIAPEVYAAMLRMHG